MIENVIMKILTFPTEFGTTLVPPAELVTDSIQMEMEW